MKRLILLVIAAALLPGCTGGNRKKLETLEEAIIHYAQALRWQRYQDAEEFQIDRQGKRHNIDEAALQHIRITGYVVRDRVVNEAVSEADVNVELEYFNDAEGTVRKTPFQQTWWYQEKSKRWFVEGELPKF